MTVIRYINRNFDDILVVSALARIAYGNSRELTESENDVLQALKRAKPDLKELNNEEISEYLTGLNEDQLLGLSNNVKGILHEIEFIEIENEDGDLITASIFPETNHQDTDILLTDHDTGDFFELQLKATDSASYVNEWIDSHPDGEILVTEELAQEMDLESSGLSNEELTASVNDFIEKIVSLDDNDSLWDYIHKLPAISIAISSFYLFLAYRKNKISWDTLKGKFIRLTGYKIAKFTLIAGLMSIPVVNVAVGAGLMYRLLYNSGTFLNRNIK